MESQQQILSQFFDGQPIPEDVLITFNPYPLPLPEELKQLQTDTINVLEGRTPIESFSPEYQKKIKNYYRFSAMRQTSKEQNAATRTTDTLDAI